MLVMATLIQPAAAQGGRSPYERMDSGQLADVLSKMKMNTLLATLVKGSAAGIEGQLLLAKSKAQQAATTPDQTARNRLIDEAVAIYDDLVTATEKATTDSGQLQHWRFRLDRIVLAGETRAQPYIERVQYFLAEKGDKAAIAAMMQPAIKELDWLIRKMTTLVDRWNSIDEIQITGAADKLADLVKEARYLGAWMRFYYAQVLDPKTGGANRRMLLGQAVADVAGYAGAEDNESGVKYSSLLLAGMAARESGDFASARRHLARADVAANPSGSDRLKAKFEIVRSYIDEKKFDQVDAEITKFRADALKLQGLGDITPVVDLQSMLLSFRRHFAEAETLETTNPVRAKQLRRAGIDLALALAKRRPVLRDLIIKMLMRSESGIDPSEFGVTYQLILAENVRKREPLGSGFAEAVKIYKGVLANLEASNGERATALWWLGAIYNEQHRNIEAGDAWRELAEKYPKDPNAKMSAVNAVKSYQGPLENAAKKKALLADKGFVTKYVAALQVLTGRYGVKDASYAYELGMMLDTLDRHQEAIEALSTIPPESELYMPARYQILLERVKDLQETPVAWLEKRRKAQALASDLESYIKHAEQFIATAKDKKQAGEVRKWAAGCLMLIARLHKDITGNIAESERNIKLALGKYRDVPGIEREASMMLLEIQLDQGKVNEVIDDLQKLIEKDPTGAEKLLAMMVPKLGLRVEQLRFDETAEAKASLKKMVPSYKKFAGTLYKFAVQKGFKGDMMRPFMQAKAHSLEFSDDPKDTQEGLNLYDTLLQTNPGNGTYIRGRARCLRKQNKPIDSLKEYDRLRDGLPEKSPEWWRIQLERLQYFMELQRAKPVRKQLEGVVLQVRIIGHKDGGKGMGGFQRAFNSIDAEAKTLLRSLPEKK